MEPTKSWNIDSFLYWFNRNCLFCSQHHEGGQRVQGLLRKTSVHQHTSVIVSNV